MTIGQYQHLLNTDQKEARTEQWQTTIVRWKPSTSTVQYYPTWLEDGKASLKWYETLNQECRNYHKILMPLSKSGRAITKEIFQQNARKNGQYN